MKLREICMDLNTPWFNELPDSVLVTYVNALCVANACLTEALSRILPVVPDFNRIRILLGECVSPAVAVACSVMLINDTPSPHLNYPDGPPPPEQFAEDCRQVMVSLVKQNVLPRLSTDSPSANALLLAMHQEAFCATYTDSVPARAPIRDVCNHYNYRYAFDGLWIRLNLKRGALKGRPVECASVPPMYFGHRQYITSFICEHEGVYVSDANPKALLELNVAAIPPYLMVVERIEKDELA